MRRTIILSTLVFMLAVQVSWGQIPQTISYQGYLTNADGTAVPDGDYSLAFSLYDVETGGIALWSETYPSVAVANGIFNVILGSLNPLTETQTPFDQQYWLGVRVNGGLELVPRIPLASSPYSLKARSVSDKAITTSKLADDAVTTGKIQPDVVSSVDGVTNDGGNIDLVPGSNITITPDDSANTITISAASDNAWKLNGNSGTDSATDFLGTTDKVSLELRVNGERALRLRYGEDADGNHVPNIIGGYSGNIVGRGIVGATVFGGGFELGGAYPNTVNASYGTVSGGLANTASGVHATVGGGWAHEASGGNATIGGGFFNQVSGLNATVGGGWENKATGVSSTVGGGNANFASGKCSVIPGGCFNTASAAQSFAAGSHAMAIHDGAFVWGDGSIDAEVSSTHENQFLVRAAGGTWLYSDPELKSGVRLSAGASAIATVSDKNMKTNIRQVAVKNILARLLEVPISRWNYKTQGPGIEHIGPMAQDFYAAFGLDEDDKYISTVDADGVALAAIQGLYEIVKENEAKNAALREKVDALESRLAKIEVLVKSLE